jgi:hypothetical protein
MLARADALSLLQCTLQHLDEEGRTAMACRR